MTDSFHPEFEPSEVGEGSVELSEGGSFEHGNGDFRAGVYRGAAAGSDSGDIGGGGFARRPGEQNQLASAEVESGSLAAAERVRTATYVASSDASSTVALGANSDASDASGVSEPASTSAVPLNGTKSVITRRLLGATVAIAAVTILLDQLSKIWAINALSDGRRIEILGEYLSLRYLRNPGAALGLGYGYTWLLTIVVIAVIIGIIRVMRRLGSRGWSWALGLLLGGAIGNLIDRLFRQPGFAQGHVVDFIAYWNWFVGNVADIAIVVAACLIILLSLRGISIDGTRETDN